MIHMVCALRVLWRNRQTDLIEYALLGGVVASASIAVFPAIGVISAHFSHAISALLRALSATASH
jgi:hypothetical protein